MALATKHGRWIRRDADIHRCGKPSLSESPGVKSGDVWQCNDCQKKWQVRVQSDQREGTWFTWTELVPPQSEGWR